MGKGRQESTGIKPSIKPVKQNNPSENKKKNLSQTATDYLNNNKDLKK